MCNWYYCLFLAFFSYDFCYYLIRFLVYSWVGFVHHHYTFWFEEHSSQAYYLGLSVAEVNLFLFNWWLDSFFSLDKMKGTFRILSSMPTFFRTLFTSSSECLLKGSIFTLIVSLKMKGNWGIQQNWFRS